MTQAGAVPPGDEETATPGERPRRRRAVAFAIAMLVAAGLVVALVTRDGDERATAPGAGEPELSAGQALLFGTVIDAGTREPLAGARLVIDQEGGQLTVVADSRGRYRAAVNASRPIGFTADARGHQGIAAFGKLCAGERKKVDLSLPPAESRSAPPAPIVVRGECG